MLKEKILNEKEINFERILLVLIVVFFSIFSLFFVFYLSKGIGPDERHHYYVSEAYSKTLGIPQNSIETFAYSDITRIPFLFNWLSGRLINVSSLLKIDSFFFLRFISFIYSLLTLLFVWFTSKQVIKKKYYRLLPVFMIATTMMFVFQGGIVTYDTLVNLFLIVSIWALVSYIKKKDSKYLFYWLLSALLACATKSTALPLVAMEFFIALYFLVKSKENIFQIIKGNKVLFVVSSLFIALNLYIYGVNLIKYKAITPTCNQVMEHESCMNNKIYERTFVLEEMEISSKGGRRIRELLLTDERMNPLDFFFDWEAKITPRLYGILGHKSISFPRNFEFLYTLLFFILIIPLIRYIKKFDKDIIVMTIVLISYTFVLVLLHYSNYLKMNTLEISMQGRYLLPVIPSAYLVQIWSLLKIRNKYIRRSLLCILILIFGIGYIYIFYKSIIEGGTTWYPGLF